MHIDDTLVYLLALVTVAVLLVGLAHALQGPLPSREQRRRAMLASHRRSAGFVIGAFAPPPVEALADVSPSPPAQPAMAPAAPVADAPAAMPAAPITPPGPVPVLASIASERALADAGGPVEVADAPAAAADAMPEESIPLDAVPAVVALTVEFARPDAVVTLDALPEPEPLVAAEASPAAPAPADLATPLVVAVAAAPAEPDVSEIAGVAQCLRAYEAGAHAAVGEAAARLARTRSSAKRSRKSVAPAPGEQVALWAILGLSRRALGETAGARAALDAAARWLPDVKLPDLPEAVVDAAPVLGRHLLLAGEDGGAAAEVRHLTLRLAAACLDWGAASGSAPDDLAALVTRARDTFATATEKRIVELIGRRDFTAAQRLVRETLGSPLVGDDRRDAFRDLLWTTLTAEVDRLVGEARAGRRAADPLKGLAAAATVVAAIPADLVGAARRDDLARRVWAGHLKLGLARAEQGDLDGAMAPLVQAVETSEADPDRHAEACAALARTVSTLVERLSAESLTELRDGDLDAALAASRRLSEVLDQALERGLSPEDLRASLERRQDVLLSIAEGRPV